MKRRYIWLIEIIVWILIISISSFFFIYKTTIKANSQNTYYFFFNDVDGLVRGSSVRLMGINIGYVRNIKIFDNKVFISFLVTKKDVIMPHKVKASIEFYGLGGSTSLELVPVVFDKEANGTQIVPTESYRVQDLWDGQKLVADTLINIYGALGRNVKKEDVPSLKVLAKQSPLVKEMTQQIVSANSQGTVIINKLTKETDPFVTQKKLENNHENDTVTIENEVQINE